jgi:twitching motility protein PilT
MALRIIPLTIPTMDELGIPPIVKDLSMLPRGLILVTGPTGSGKSTTLASMVDLINHKKKYHILTLEDPIEYLHKHDKSIVNQREIGSDSLSFANALRAALRQDPDVILVGEMRDLETMSIALTAAETGHLVLSTLHTIGAASTIDRIIDVFPSYQQQQVRIQLSSVIQGIISQQLLPMIDGKGRIAAFEIMVATPAIRNLIREEKTHQIDTAIQTGSKYGMQTMDNSMLKLFNKGKISEETVLSQSVFPDVIKRYLK